MLGAGHGPVARTGAAAQRAGAQLIHRAGRQTGQRDGARLLRVFDRRPRASGMLNLRSRAWNIRLALAGVQWWRRAASVKL